MEAKTMREFVDICTAAAQGRVEHHYGHLTITGSRYIAESNGYYKTPVPVSILIRMVVEQTAEAVTTELLRNGKITEEALQASRQAVE